jgi:hypothetical protein
MEQLADRARERHRSLDGIQAEIERASKDPSAG